MLFKNRRQHRSLKQLMASEELIYSPGVWNGLSAILAEREGFSTLFASGFAISASLGLPDAELYTMSENLDAVRKITTMSSLPIICDIDTGYGNAINVMRTVHEFERAGADALFIEDQVAPKRCPLSLDSSVGVISIEEAVGKIRAACDVREGELLIIARIDSTGSDAMKRAEAYVEAGADLLMPVTKTFNTLEEWEKCHNDNGVPLLATLTSNTWVERDFTPDVMKQIGVKIALLPLQILYSSVSAMIGSLNLLHAGEKPSTVTSHYISHHEFSEIIGFGDVADLENRFLPKTNKPIN